MIIELGKVSEETKGPFGGKLETADPQNKRP